MNSKYFATLLVIFGLLFTLAQCGRLKLRNNGGYDTNNNDDSSDGDNSNDNDNNGGGNGGDSDDDDDALRSEKRAILSFIQNEEDASQFLDQSRRLFSDQKSQMKEAKKAYEEKCERLLHPRYCPDLATWPAWNQAFSTATGKK